MKRCPYCGRENADEAAACFECGTRFISDVDVPTGRVDIGAPAPTRACKISFILAAFALAMLTMLPLGGLLFFQPLLILAFPSGLWAVATGKEAGTMSTLTAWFFYVALITALGLSRRRTWFVFFYVVLCIALAVNVTGCYQVVGAAMHELK